MTTRIVACGMFALSLAGLSSAQQTDTAARTKTFRVPGTTVSFDLIRVEGGQIEVDGVSHEVPTLWVLPHEVTWDLYDIYLYELDKPEDERTGTGKGADAVTRPSKPYVPPDRGLGHEGYPAMGMTIHAAERFSAWLGESLGMTCRLPTKAEWVHVAGEASQDEAWSDENADYTTHPVGKLPANEHGLHDMLGNVAEWVVTDEKRPVAMGGSYRQPAAECTPLSAQQQTSSWNASDPQIPKSSWWLADCSWVGFRFVVEEGSFNQEEAGDDE